MRRLAPILFAALLFSANSFTSQDVATEGHKPGAGTDINKKLAVDEKTSVTHNALFDQLVGSWDVRSEILGTDGRLRRDRGQVRYSWILDGQALQEIWSSNSGSKDLQQFGTAIDFYDPKRQRWTAVWIYPAQGMTSIMTGGEVNGSLVLTGHDESGALERWSTNVSQP